MSRFYRPLRWVCGFALLAAVLFAASALPIADWLRATKEWFQAQGILGPVYFGLAFVGAGLLLMPASLFAVASGAIFGVGVGWLTASIAATVAACLAFLLSRFLLRDRLAARMQGHPKYRAVDHAVAKNGWKILALMRQSPAIPYGVENYVFGVTGISFRAYVLTTWLAMLPGGFVYVSLGWAGMEGVAAAAGEERKLAGMQWALLALGVLATVAVTAYVGVIAKRALGEEAK